MIRRTVPPATPRRLREGSRKSNGVIVDDERTSARSFPADPHRRTAMSEKTVRVSYVTFGASFPCTFTVDKEKMTATMTKQCGFLSGHSWRVDLREIFPLINEAMKGDGNGDDHDRESR